jgi:hypothetical protein
VLARRNGQQLGQQRCVFGLRDGGRDERRRELGELGRRSVIRREVGDTFEVGDKRVQRARHMVRRAEIAQPHVRHTGQPLDQRGADPRFPDPGLASQHHDLALALLRLFPAAKQQIDLLLPPNQRYLLRVERLEPVLRGALAQNFVRVYRIRETLEGDRPEAAQVEQISQQPARSAFDDDCARLSHSLHSCSEVRRFADHVVLLRGTLADPVTDHDLPCRHADTGRETGASAGIETAYGSNELESRAYGALGIVFVSPRPAEIGEDPVAHVLGDIAVPSADRLRAATPVGSQERAQIFRIELCGQSRRAHEIAEQDCDLSALGLG